MGTQKLILPFGESTVIETVVRTALDSSVEDVLVVVGPDREKIREILRPYPVTFVVNEDHLRGMLSSVQAGFRALPEKATAAMLMLGDQPSVTSEMADELLPRHRETRKGIVIPVYENRRGHPVIISTRYRKEILELGPDTGLRQLSRNHPEDVLEVALPFAAILRDIDTPEDYLAERKG